MTSDDISSIVPARGKSVRVHRRVEEKSETQVAHATTVDHQILRPSRSVDEEAIMEARVHEHDLEVRNLRRCVVDFPELTATRGGVWLAFG